MITTKILKPMAFCGLLSASLFAVGCAEESTVKTETEVKTPSGSQTITEEKKVESTGDAKSTEPVVPAEKPATP